jgi:hypothetical protein
MKRLVGYDLNGWHDFSARNWLEVPGQEDLEGQDQVINGGLGSVVVKVGSVLQGAGFVGGVQALRAPHGRGTGWGDVGANEKRTNLLKLLDHPSDHKAEISSAIFAMADARKATAVLAIPDIPVLDEDHQDALLNCLRTLRASRILLVWRPVLTVLAALEDLSDVQWENVSNIGVIGHNSKGFASQRLQLRKEKLFAPERRSLGRQHNCALGLETLLIRANEALKEPSANPQRTEHIEVSQLPFKLALGHVCETEPLRKWNGSWEVVSPPEELAFPKVSIPKELVEHLADCDIILFHTPSIGSVRDNVVGSLEEQIGTTIHCLEPQAIARGALKAGARLLGNQPVYYDFLPQISTIIQDSDGTKNYDLIPPDALLPAGQSYRSSQPARLGLVAGMQEIKVHLKKENDATPRLAVVSLATPPAANTPVELHLEQTPAAGRARLTLLSKAFTGPMVVDWQKAEELDQGWEEVIESLEPEKPTVPNRLVLPCGTDTWFEQDNRPGLDELLDRELIKSQPDWGVLASKLSSRSFGKYSISSDGEFPDELPQSLRSQLQDTISIAEKDVHARLDGTGSKDNQSLRFLTWLFHMCPEWVVPHLLDGAEAQTGNHPFVKSGGSRALMLQGIGRTAQVSLPLRNSQMVCRIDKSCQKRTAIQRMGQVRPLRTFLPQRRIEPDVLQFLFRGASTTGGIFGTIR